MSYAATKGKSIYQEVAEAVSNLGEPSGFVNSNDESSAKVSTGLPQLIRQNNFLIELCCRQAEQIEKLTEEIEKLNYKLSHPDTDFQAQVKALAERIGDVQIAVKPTEEPKPQVHKVYYYKNPKELIEKAKSSK